MASSSLQCVLFSLLLASLESQLVFWSEPMNTTSLPTDWTSSNTNDPTFGSSSCATGTTSCWEYTSAAITTSTTNPISSLQHNNIELTYKVRVTTGGGARGSCFVEYASDGSTTYSTIASYSSDTDTTETFSSWNPSADESTNGISLRIRTQSNLRSINCYFNDFALNGVLVTTLPTLAPNTLAPSASPDTASPSSSSSPTNALASPTNAPITSSPTTKAEVGTISSIYAVDVYKSVDFTVDGNSPETPLGSPPNNYPPDNYPYIALPMNLCTRNGDDPNVAKRIKWQCDGSNALLSRCEYSSEAECESTSCKWDTTAAASFDQSINRESSAFGFGTCTNGAATKSQNYLEVYYYLAYTHSEAGCPGTAFTANGSSYRGFDHVATDRFATGICTKQDDATYILTKCDINSGEIGLYSDAQCTQLDTVLISYDTACSIMTLSSDGVPGGPLYFRRFEGCYVNSSNIVRPTNDPTTEPTNAPTTFAPSTAPIGSPTNAPITSDPTLSPTENPAVIPTTSANPTKTPTKLPTTPRPTKPPVYYTSSPTRSPTQAPTTKGDKLLNDAVSMTLIQYCIGVLVVVYGIIACGVWCSERSKRLAILNPSDKMRKKQFAAARKRRLDELQMQSMNKERQAVRSMSGMEGNRGERL